MTDNSFLYCQLPHAKKARYINAARRRRMKLTEWVIESLDKAARYRPPAARAAVFAVEDGK